MDSQTIQDLCEVAAGVPANGVGLLARLSLHLDLLADLALADLALLVPANQPGQLLVLAEGRPRVTRSLYPKPRAADLLSVSAEPLAAQTLRTGRPRRSRYAALMSGRPVEQLVLPIRDAQRSVVAALSVERSLLNGPWSAARRPLAEAARSLATSLLKAALAPGDLLILLRMARGLTVLSADGEVLFTDPTARASWAKALGRAGLPGRLPPGAPPGSTLLGRHEEPWGSEWEFDVHGSVFRRRDLRLGADPAGGTLVLLQDVTALHAGQAVVSTRAAAFQEIHHRVKNNLQTISSLLRMQARRETSEPARDSLRTAIARVQSVAFVHEVLSLDGAEEIDLKALATTLADSAVHDAHGGRGRIVAAVLGPRLFVPAARASQVALVLNEALQNAVKHAFPDDRPGSVTVRFEPRAEEVVVTVQDDGIGLPTDLALRKTGALGLQIARTIAESDLGGKLTLAGNGGTTFALRLPASLAHQETENP